MVTTRSQSVSNSAQRGPASALGEGEVSSARRSTRAAARASAPHSGSQAASEPRSSGGGAARRTTRKGPGKLSAAAQERALLFACEDALGDGLPPSCLQRLAEFQSMQLELH